MITVENNDRKYGRLKERIREKFKTQQLFAQTLGVNLATLNLKLNGKTSWTSNEIEKVCILLDISTNEIIDYFFY